MSDPDLFPLLHNRMSRENQDVPEFIGEFDGVGALPKGEYPAIYYWVDREHGCARLSFNTPLLSCWCVEEAHRAGIDVDASDVAVLEAINKLQQVATPTFQHMLASMSPRSEGLRAGAEAAVESQYQARHPRKNKPWWRLW